LACIIAGALLPLQVSAQSTQLVVIELNSRTADEVIPLLKPMLAPGGTISGLKDKLIIRSTPENLAELRSMLDVVDARPRRLLITVGRDRDGLDETREIGVSGSIGNDNVRIVLPDTSESAAMERAGELHSKQNSVQVRANSTRSDTSLQVSQTVQVLDGGTAFIGVGESIPLRERSAVGAVSSHETIGFQETVSGFYAVPRVRGNRVNVQLAAAADTVIDRRSGAAHIQRVTTVVSGRIGEWIEVGGISEATSERQAEIASRRGGASRSQKRIYIKVDEIR
jgi:type II secretory pathway component GspD/PulD (secretin)